MIRPSAINILGIVYQVTYCDRVAEVDANESAALAGQIDFRRRTIRILDGGRQPADMLCTLLHEVIHGIAQALHLETFGGGAPEGEAHTDMDRLSLALADVMIRNGWVAGKEGA